MSLTGCGLLAGLEPVPIPADGGATGTGDGSSGGHADAHGGADASVRGDAKGPPPGVDSGGHDAGVAHDTGVLHDSGVVHDTGGKADAGSKSDASDATVVLPGYIQCGTTSQTCDLAGGQECCLNLYGSTTTGSAVYNESMGSCEVIGGPNCGIFASEGDDFMESFPETCAGAADCDASVCCGHVADGGAGSAPMIGSIACATRTSCATSGQIVCKTNSDCPTGTTCIGETDPLLVHLWSRRCSP
jgi:hypothetical protein